MGQFTSNTRTIHSMISWYSLWGCRVSSGEVGNKGKYVRWWKTKGAGKSDQVNAYTFLKAKKRLNFQGKELGTWVEFSKRGQLSLFPF